MLRRLIGPPPGLRKLCNTTMETLKSSLIITNACAKRIQALRSGAHNPRLNLRIAVEGGGCSGFQYKFVVDDAPVGPEDREFKRGDVSVLVDEMSLGLIKAHFREGATIDYQTELIRSAFAIVNNPMSESACGCGSSFAAKNFESNPALD